MTAPNFENSPADVRMRGFTSRTTVDAALTWLDSALLAAGKVGSEDVCLSDAAQRVLSRDVTSHVDVPSFSRSMMDGFALRGEETYGATSYNPLAFRIVGTCLPGIPFPGQVAVGQAVRIMTGAPMPVGADAVLPGSRRDCGVFHLGKRAQHALDLGELNAISPDLHHEVLAPQVDHEAVIEFLAHVSG